MPSWATHAGKLKHFLSPLQLGLQQVDALAWDLEGGSKAVVEISAVFVCKVMATRVYSLWLQGRDISLSWQEHWQWLSDPSILSLGGSFSRVSLSSAFPGMAFWFLSDSERGSSSSVGQFCGVQGVTPNTQPVAHHFPHFPEWFLFLNLHWYTGLHLVSRIDHPSSCCRVVTLCLLPRQLPSSPLNSHDPFSINSHILSISVQTFSLESYPWPLWPDILLYYIITFCSIALLQKNILYYYQK